VIKSAWVGVKINFGLQHRLKESQIYFGRAILIMNIITTFFIIYTAIAFIGVGYALVRDLPNIFLKNATGTLELKSYLIFWPYFTLNVITLYLFRIFSQENRLDEIVPNLYMGGRLLMVDSKYFASLGIKSTLDLTSEFREIGFIRTGQNYLCIPILDTRYPTLNQLDEAISWISTRMLDGPVFVHCALGHGRSATVVAGFLIKYGIVNNVDGAIEFIKATRIGVSLHPKQIKVLQQFAIDIQKNNFIKT